MPENFSQSSGNRKDLLQIKAILIRSMTVFDTKHKSMKTHRSGARVACAA